MRELARPGELPGLKTVKFRPSKRTRPPKVPSHRYPSCDWTIDVTVFCGRPSAVVHPRAMNACAAAGGACGGTAAVSQRRAQGTIRGKGAHHSALGSIAEGRLPIADRRIGDCRLPID